MWIEELANGRFKFVERYNDYLTGKKKKVSVTLDKNTAATRKFAQAELLKKIEDKQSCSLTHENITLQKLYDNYIKYQTTEVRTSTLQRNKISVGKVIDMLGRKTLVDNITALYVNDCFNRFNVDKNKRVEYVTRFKAMLRWGYDNDFYQNIQLITKLKATPEISEHQKVKYKFLEPDEIGRILEELKKKPDWYYLTYFLLLSGLRVGEALALHREDICNEYIKVNKTCNLKTLELGSPKTPESNRVVFIQDELKELIKRIKIYESEKNSGIKSIFFFSGADGQPLHYAPYCKFLKKSAQRVGIDKKVTPHMLRHTHASILLAKGMSIDAISRRLGHSDSKVTKDIYLHVTKQLQANDNKEISSINIL